MFAASKDMGLSMVKTIVGIDVGGTFTDIAILQDGKLTIHKLPSTPADPAEGVRRGIAEINVGDAEYVHGSTVATNALLEGKGGRTALVTTLGFEDVLEIGRQSRSDLYDLNLERPPALAPRELRFGLPERVDYTGAILEDLTPAAIEALVAQLQEARVDGVAVCFLFSFLNPLHEEMLLESLRRMPNPPFISISSQVIPEFREYERTSTVVMNSYVGPVMARYLNELENSLGSELRVMQSSGGSITARMAAEQPVRTVLSGPAGGVVGAFHTGVVAGYLDLITLDMGGTSTDVSLCPGRIKETTSATLGGYPISVPMIEIHTVGAGGGSIARIDAGGALVVGPESAGADPGPACYGKGDRITVTDANLVLGRLCPAQFLGGRLPLDKPRAEQVISGLAAQIGSGVQETALGIIRVVNANMERAIRTISLERGYDPRRFTLIPFGGAGPMHCCELAQELGIPRVLAPTHPGILSALGVAIANVVKDYSRTVMLRGGEIDRQRLEEEFHGMENRAREELRQEGLPVDRMTAHRFLDARYVGQSFELTIDYPAPSSRRSDLQRAIANRFYQVHMQRFGYADRTEAVEIVNLRLKLELEVEKPIPRLENSLEDTDPKPGQSSSSKSESEASAALIEEAEVVFREGVLTTGLYQRERLMPGNRIAGPALMLQLDTTIVVPPGWGGVVDPFGNLILEPL